MESRRYGLILLLALALDAGFAALAWIGVVKQAIVRFITLCNFPILHSFPLRYHPPAEASFAGALMSVDVGAESFVSGDQLLPETVLSEEICKDREGMIGGDGKAQSV